MEKLSFKDFLSYFEHTELPITLKEGAEHQFSLKNDLLPDDLVNKFIKPALNFELDEFTEIVPCVFWNTKYQHVASIFWCARLMRYTFYIIIFDQDGNPLDNAEIAGFFSDQEEIIYSMANIDEEETIYIVEASHSIEAHELNKDKTRKTILEIVEDGRIVQLPE
ncbi:MAG: hypothetical protein M3Q56_00795 [Bacteroidota bacterium]|nr:hypothetical protein [Bacteroidota bacterium]